MGDFVTTGFTTIEINNGLQVDLSMDEFPTEVYAWTSHGQLGAMPTALGRHVFDLQGDATHYGMVIDGCATLAFGETEMRLRPGMFFVAPGAATVSGGRGLVVSRLGYSGLFQVGGPIEDTGRLVYIDGCSDTLLVCPPRLGEPCLNHLHLPPGTNQSEHTHPSERIGIILRGSGECRTPDGTFALRPGMAWRIPTGCLHSFFTFDESMDVLAWHPDSDFGPTDDNHPMKNRTYLKHGENENVR